MTETPQTPWLLTELGELRENLRDTIGNDYARVVESIERRLREELPAHEALAQDAARYRWLRNDMDGDKQDDLIRDLSQTVYGPTDIDHKFDNAMAGEPDPNE